MSSFAARPSSPKETSSVQVVVRLRPLNDKEKKHGTLPVVSASTNDKTVTVIKGSGSRQAKTSYKFDNVFTAFSSQEEVFQATLQPVIRDVLMGFESTVFAYGQTGTGKTHTMEGDLSNPELHGVIPRSAAAIFQALEHPHYLEKNLCVSFLEIYNEDLCDLLAESGPDAKKPKLDIMEGKNGPFCRGLSETQVSSAEEVLALMRRAQNYRQVGETNMNQQSSRSHCIFTLKVQAKRKVGDGTVLEVSGKLHCVDLAGSECAKSAELDNDQQASRERERMNINRSLLTLGRVVSMLKEQSQGKTSKHMRIPYRDSKLTRILQESLGGRCKTCLIATVSPSVSAIEESMSTLNYAQAANGIINKPVISSLMAIEASSVVFNGVKSSSGETGTIEHWHEMEVRLQYMQSQVEEAQQALARKHLQQQELTERAEMAEAAQVAAVAELDEVKRQKAVLEQEIVHHVSEKEAISSKLTLTENTLRETLEILKATQETERRLTNEAQVLLALLRKATQDGDAMHTKLLHYHQDDAARKQATKGFHATMLALLDETTAGLRAIDNTFEVQNVTLRDSAFEHFNSQKLQLQRNDRIARELSKSIGVAVKALQILVDDDLMEAASSFASNVAVKFRSLQKSNSDHCTCVMSSSEDLRAALLAAREVLGKREDQFKESSSHLLECLQSYLEESKHSISQMISSVTNATVQGRGERKDSCSSLLEMIEKWKSTSVNNTRCMGDVSIVEGANVNSLIDILEKESKRHEEVGRMLAAQNSFLGEQRMKHLSHLEGQGNMLEMQQRAYKESEQRAKEICNTVMTNILSGVQDLVKNEFSSIAEYHQRSTGSFVEVNQGLVKSNRAIVDDFASTFKRLEGNTTTLQSHAAVLSSRNQEASRMLQRTSQSLIQIRDDSTRMEQSVQESSELINNHMVAADETDQTRTDHHISSIRRRNKDFLDQLDNDVSEKCVPRIGDLVGSVAELATFVREDIIGSACERLHNNIETPLASALKTSDQLVKEILIESARHEQAVSTLATTQMQTLDDLLQTSGGLVSELSTAFVSQAASFDQFKDSIVERCDSNGAEMSKKIGEENDRTSAAKDSVDVFAQSVIQVDIEAPTIDARNVLTYSEELSSTPPDHIILENLTGKADPVSERRANAIFGSDAETRKNEVDCMNRTLSNFPVLHEKTNAKQPQALDEPGKFSKRRSGASTGVNDTAKRVRTLR